MAQPVHQARLALPPAMILRALLCPTPLAHPAVRMALAFLLASFAVAPAARADVEPDLALAIVHDSNVTRAQLREDIRPDSLIDARASLGWHAVSGSDDVVEAALGLHAWQYARFVGLSSVALEARALWRRKLGLGRTAPWIAASIAAAHDDFRDNTRDSDTLNMRVELGRRWSESLDLSGGYALDRRLARRREPLVPGISGAVWDVRGESLFGRAGYALSARWLVDVGASVRRGDVVATTRQHLDIFEASDAIAASGSFGPGFYDYRLRGTTRSVTATLSRDLGPDAALDLGYAFALTRAGHDLDYRNHLVSLTWTYRY
jgi:hypothetical protein